MTLKKQKVNNNSDEKNNSIKDLLEDTIKKHFDNMTDKEYLQLLKEEYGGSIVNACKDKEQIYLMMRKTGFDKLYESCKKNTYEIMLDNKFERYAALEQYYSEHGSEQDYQIALREQYFSDNLSYHVANQENLQLEVKNLLAKISRMRPHYKRKNTKVKKQIDEKHTDTTYKIEEQNNKYNTDIEEVDS